MAKPLESTALLASSTAVGLLQSSAIEFEVTTPIVAVTAGHILFTELNGLVEEP
eukprot:CAMPEP_0180655814 /NCGR_PEP_ID=MMETSP1037_2-20121125/55493_1 /TAXON_ID=632150 /ORGANISM="Azadinium spinosum, Strain 3D9" /LENGTH=53 /DNA_ID=CAMNT_0022682303 /DNA_START=99 /DNA_END=257 /DNA_ORIENTATION=-